MLVRPLEETDRSILQSSIIADEYHRDTTTSDFFYDKRALCHVYETDEHVPIMFVKGSPVLRLDIQWVSNDDNKNNAEALYRLSQIIETAKTSGFMELVFNTDSPLLKAFCCKNFGFEEVYGVLRRYI